MAHRKPPADVGVAYLVRGRAGHEREDDRIAALRGELRCQDGEGAYRKVLLFHARAPRVADCCAPDIVERWRRRRVPWDVAVPAAEVERIARGRGSGHQNS